MRRASAFSKVLAGVAGLCCFALVGCGSLYYLSVIRVEQGERMAAEYDLIERVFVERWGDTAQCAVFRPPNLRCTVDYADIEHVSFISEPGDARIVIDAFKGVFFPLAKYTRNDGSYAPEGLPEMEDWVFQQFGSYGISEAYRSHDGKKLKLR